MLLQSLLQVGGKSVLPLDFVRVIRIHRPQQQGQRLARRRTNARQQTRHLGAQIGGSLHQRQLLGLHRQHRFYHALSVHLADWLGVSSLFNKLNSKHFYTNCGFYWRNCTADMAVRGITNHYLIEKIQRRHWIAQAQQVGLGAEAAERLIEEIIESTDAVINEVSKLLPENFPMDLAEAIFSGMKKHCARLATINS